MTETKKKKTKVFQDFYVKDAERLLREMFGEHGWTKGAKLPRVGDGNLFYARFKETIGTKMGRNGFGAALIRHGLVAKAYGKRPPGSAKLPRPASDAGADRTQEDILSTLRRIERGIAAQTAAIESLVRLYS